MKEPLYEKLNFTEKEYSDAFFKCCTVMEENIFEDFDVDRKNLQLNVASYMYSLFSFFILS